MTRRGRHTALYRTALTATVLLSASITPASAQDPAPVLPQVTLRATPALPPEAIEWIARTSLANPLKVPANINPEDILKLHCNGTVSDAYRRVFQEMNPGYLGKPQPREREFIAPACIGWRINAPIVAKPGDTLESIIRRTTGASGSDILYPCAPSKPDKHCGRSLMELIVGLNPLLPGPDEALAAGTKVIVPLISGPTTVALQPQANMNADQQTQAFRDGLWSILDASKAETTGDTPAAKQVPPTTEQSDTSGAIHIGPMSVKNIKKAECLEAGKDRADWPFDRQRVTSILATAYAHAYKRQDGAPPATVIRVVDTGFYLNSPALLPTAFRAKNPYEKNPTDGKDDPPKNNWVDDVYGIGPNKNGDVEPYPGHEDAAHGTQVADLLLGGASFRNAQPNLDKMLKLHFVKASRSQMYSENGVTKTAYPIGMDMVGYAMNYGQVRANIIQLSIGSSDQLPTLLDTLATDKYMVWVVAAGNEERNLGVKATYPAAYGGLASPRIITVGASDGTRQLAEFSNKSKRYVDLLAPGCDIPGVGNNNTTTRLFGTSFAAPLVGFTIGLLRTIGVEDISVAKARLYAGVDYDPRLKEDVASGGVLNIPKTLMIYQDAFQPRPGALPVEGQWLGIENTAGELTYSQDAIALCEDGSVYSRQQILKITRISADNAPPLLRVLYWDDRGNVEEKNDCKPKGAGIAFHSQLPAKHTRWAEFHDLVPRYYSP